ncbi:hypothetical protein HDU93_004187, partial [Gonapodya sp. JEL0774]
MIQSSLRDLRQLLPLVADIGIHGQHEDKRDLHFKGSKWSCVSPGFDALEPGAKLRVWNPYPERRSFWFTIPRDVNPVGNSKYDLVLRTEDGMIVKGQNCFKNALHFILSDVQAFQIVELHVEESKIKDLSDYESQEQILVQPAMIVLRNEVAEITVDISSGRNAATVSANFHDSTLHPKKFELSFHDYGSFLDGPYLFRPCPTTPFPLRFPCERVTVQRGSATQNIRFASALREKNSSLHDTSSNIGLEVQLVLREGEKDFELAVHIHPAVERSGNHQIVMRIVMVTDEAESVDRAFSTTVPGESSVFTDRNGMFWYQHERRSAAPPSLADWIPTVGTDSRIYDSDHDPASAFQPATSAILLHPHYWLTMSHPHGVRALYSTGISEKSGIGCEVMLYRRILREFWKPFSWTEWPQLGVSEELNDVDEIESRFVVRALSESGVNKDLKKDSVWRFSVSG